MEASERCVIGRIAKVFAAASVADSVSTSSMANYSLPRLDSCRGVSNSRLHHSYTACNEAQWLSSCISIHGLHESKHAAHSMTCPHK
jgi:hypothetical protein